MVSLSTNVFETIHKPKDFKIVNDKIEYGLEKITMQPIKNMYGYIYVT